MALPALYSRSVESMTHVDMTFAWPQPDLNNAISGCGGRQSEPEVLARGSTCRPMHRNEATPRHLVSGWWTQRCCSPCDWSVALSTCVAAITSCQWCSRDNQCICCHCCHVSLRLVTSWASLSSFWSCWRPTLCFVSTTMAQMPLDTSRLVTSRLDTTRTTCRACRPVLFYKLDTAKMHWLDTSNVSCRVLSIRDMTWRDKWNLGLYGAHISANDLLVTLHMLLASGDFTWNNLCNADFRRRRCSSVKCAVATNQRCCSCRAEVCRN